MPIVASRSNSAAFGYGWGNKLADAGAMTAIATSTPSGVSTITFSSIPSTYDDLFVVTYGFSTTASSTLRMRVNSDTGTNYSDTSLVGDGDSATSSRSTSAAHLFCSGLRTATPAISNVHINNYANTSNYKTTIIRNSFDENGAGQTRLHVGLWRSTSAVSSITIYDANSYNFGAGTVFALYGIKKAA